MNISVSFRTFQIITIGRRYSHSLSCMTHCVIKGQTLLCRMLTANGRHKVDTEKTYRLRAALFEQLCAVILPSMLKNKDQLNEFTQTQREKLVRQDLCSSYLRPRNNKIVSWLSTLLQLAPLRSHVCVLQHLPIA